MSVRKVEFLTPCDLRVLPQGSWQVLSDFVSRITYGDGAIEVFTVEHGFVTDLASVPRVPFLYDLFGGKAREASVLHDRLYRSDHNREIADAVFYAAMAGEGEPWWTRTFMWLGVRIGGSFAYRGTKPAIEIATKVAAKAEAKAAATETTTKE